jgi:hypothetical protein
MSKHLLAASIVALLGVATSGAAGQQIVMSVDQEQRAEAIRLAADAKMSARFLDAYGVQTRAGWGNGPLIGSFSTPFSRVVQAAAAARRRATPFGIEDIPLELLVPELHVVATSQRAWPDET